MFLREFDKNDTQIDKTIKVLENERKCVERQIISPCDRNCAVCDLVLPTDTVVGAYDEAITLLQKISRRSRREKITKVEPRLYKFSHGDTFTIRDELNIFKPGEQYKNYPAFVKSVVYSPKKWWQFWRRKKKFGYVVEWVGN